jgi:hypothetical protein
MQDEIQQNAESMGEVRRSGITQKYKTYMTESKRKIRGTLKMSFDAGTGITLPYL